MNYDASIPVGNNHKNALFVWNDYTFKSVDLICIDGTIINILILLSKKKTQIHLCFHEMFLKIAKHLLVPEFCYITMSVEVSKICVIFSKGVCYLKKKGIFLFPSNVELFPLAYMKWIDYNPLQKSENNCKLILDLTISNTCINT